MEKYLGEFLGTMVLMVFGNGIGASISLNKSLAKGFSPNWFTVVFGWGLAVTLGVYTAGFYNTGGHLNPAVTIALRWVVSSLGSKWWAISSLRF